MRVAIEAARKAVASQDIPVGAAIFNKAGELVSTGHNERELHNDPTAPAFSSQAPNTTVCKRDCAIAPAHIAQGSSVTTKV